MENKKYCKRCDSHKSLDSFSKDKSTKDGLQFYCKKCSAEESAKYRTKKPKEKRPCENKSCNNTFETSNHNRKYCCEKCLIESQKTRCYPDARFRYNFKVKFLRKKLPKENNYKTWDSKEDKKLLKYKNKGLTFYQIAEKMGRGYDGVRSRYKILIEEIRRGWFMDFKVEAKRKKDNKKIKGYVIKDSKKYYVVSGKMSKYYNNDYIWLEKGKEYFEVIPETIKFLIKGVDEKKSKKVTPIKTF